MAFGGKVQHGTGAVLGQQGIHHHAVAQVALHEHMARIALQASEVLDVASVGELVEVEDRLIRLGKPVEHKVTAYEASTACYQNH